MLRAVVAAWGEQLGKEWFEAYAENELEAQAMYESSVARNGYR